LSKVGDALEVIPKLGGKFDLLFIDVNNEKYLAADAIELSNRIV
jgi:predicted O-methyltransferase YrrM